MSNGGGRGRHPRQGRLSRHHSQSKQARYRRQIDPDIKFQQQGVVKIHVQQALYIIVLDYGFVFKFSLLL